MYLRINKRLKPLAREMRNNMTFSEVKLWNELKNGKLDGFDFGRQVNIGRYIADFCCEKAHLVIEVDGSSHIGKNEYDSERDAFLGAMGFRILRVWNGDVLNNLDGVLEEIRKMVLKPHTPSAPSAQPPLSRKGI